MTALPRRIYLDCAATSWPKSPVVGEAMVSYLSEIGATASRGGYASARRAGHLVAAMRRRLAEWIHAPDTIDVAAEQCISFHGGCTLAIHTAIEGLEIAGRKKSVPTSSAFHVVASAAEHNAVLRSLRHRCDREHGALTVVPTDQHGLVQFDELVESVRPETRLVALTHASNVTGQIQPVEEVGRWVNQQNESRPSDRQIAFLCDAAQTIGYLPIDVERCHIDLLAAPAHKGMGGPPGIAMLYVSPAWHDRISPVIHGGTGQDGHLWTMPVAMPQKLEPGTMNLPALAGWQAALDEVSALPSDLSSHAIRFHAKLREVDGLSVLGSPGPLPVASIDFGPDLKPVDAAAILDAEFGVEVRAGFHCAAAIHEFLGTSDGGTVRLSGGHATADKDYDVAVDAIAEIQASLREIHS